MSAFQAFAGAYEFAGKSYSWQCYATVRIHEIRQFGHAPFPSTPTGRKWLAAPRQPYEPDVRFLVDMSVEEFSQILLQVQPHSPPAARPPERRGEAASAAA